jgi:hypothetical protein
MMGPTRTPEDEAKAAAAEQYDLVLAQHPEYGWEPKVVDAGDYLVVFTRITKLGGRTFLMRLRCDDYPEVAPLLHFVDPATFENPSLDAEPAPECYPIGDYVVPVGQRGALPVLCVKGHRDYYAAGWHGGWSNPPAHDHAMYQLVVNVRNAIFDLWA